jgi:hypothetical protein
MTFPIVQGENALAIRKSRPAAATDVRVVRQKSKPQEGWFEALRTPIEIGMVLLRIVEIAILVA